MSAGPASSPARPAPLGFLALLARALGARATPWLVIALAVACAATSLDTGYQTDDHFLLARLHGDPDYTRDGPTATDVFRFVGGDVPAGIARGAYPWWTAPDARLGFFRPLSGLTHALDEAIAPGSPLVAHAQNVLWFAALLVVALALFRRLARQPWVAHLALVVYGLDDARGPTVGWIANRNALICGVLAMLALLAHDRLRRDGWRPGRWLGPLAFAAALLAGEPAVGSGGYLVAHAIFLDPDGVRRQPLPVAVGRVAARLWPYLALGAAWLVVHRLGGYGAHGADGYLDPFDRPLAYLVRALETVPVLLGASLGVWSDFFPAVTGGAEVAYIMIDVAVVAIWLWLLRPLWRALAAVRFALVGAALATLPVAGALVTDRQLVFVALGVSLAAAELLAQVLDPALRAPGQSERFFKRLVKPTAAIVALLWIVAGPLGLAARSRGMAYVGKAVDETLTFAAAEPTRHLLAVNLPNEALLGYLLPTCATRGLACPRAHALLATMHAVRVARPAVDTLVLAVDEGLFATQADRMMTRADRLGVGAVVAFDGIAARVTATTPDGRVAAVRFVFPTPLEDPTWRFAVYDETGPHAWTPPPVGGTVVVPAIDAMTFATRFLQDPP